jgi:hypothetical protein
MVLAQKLINKKMHLDFIIRCDVLDYLYPVKVKVTPFKRMDTLLWYGLRLCTKETQHLKDRYRGFWHDPSRYINTSL